MSHILDGTSIWEALEDHVVGGLYIKAQTDIEVTSRPFLCSGGPILKQSRHDKRREGRNQMA